MNKQNVILDKSKVFAIRIIKMYQYLNSQKKEYIFFDWYVMGPPLDTFF